MRSLLLLSIIFSLCGCESYHVFCASQSIGPEQASHIQALAQSVKDDENKEAGKTVIYVCEYYPAGMGGFTSTCNQAK